MTRRERILEATESLALDLLDGRGEADLPTGLVLDAVDAGEIQLVEIVEQFMLVLCNEFQEPRQRGAA